VLPRRGFEEEDLVMLLKAERNGGIGRWEGQRETDVLGGGEDRTGKQ
jgi:hypothetical protein